MYTKCSHSNLKRRELLEKSECGWDSNIKMVHKEMRCRLNSAGSGQGLVAVLCVHYSEHSDSIDGG
jgi:hypothetical protein